MRNYVNKKLKLDSEYKKEIKNYYKQHGVKINTYTHKMYFNVTGKKDVRFIPDYIFFSKINPYFNNVRLGRAIGDKSYYDRTFKELKRPETIIKNVNGVFYDKDFKILKKSEAMLIIEKILKIEKELIIKPSIDSGSGKNVKVINGKTEIRELIEEYKKDYVIQKLVKQSPELSKIHKNSLNTIRVSSLLWKGEVIILSAILRIGVGDSRIDNFSAGGICCGIDEKGTLKGIFYNKKGEKIDLPNTFEDITLKGFESVIQNVKNMHKKIAHFKIIGWDFAIDENYEPVFIEANLSSAELDFHQFCNGPLFGDLTEEILTEVFIENKK